ncbi:MAG: S9 family peptidase [Xanthomonadaceae bacterium]|jgi:dipeptidyl aminopeptidase/acylaminoacyl peptidase|nr:S9 family peptidase [Xanthomonadaceae bacterium]
MKLRYVWLSLCLMTPVGWAADRGFDVRDLVALERVSSLALTPDGGMVVFAKREVDAAFINASTGLWIRDLRTRDLAPPRRLTPEGWHVSSPEISPDGKTVYFLSAKSGTQQLYSIPLRGGTPHQLTMFPLDVGSYRLSPEGTRVAFSVDVFLDCAADFECTKQRLDDARDRPSSGVVYDRLFVRHWDTWVDGRRSALFTAYLPRAGGKVASVTGIAALSTGLDGDIPSKPFGDTSEYAWAPDGESLVASMRVADRSEAWSTNFDLYRFRSDGDGVPVNLTTDNPAWDTGPVFSADGKTLYYRAMQRPGFESDRFRIMKLDLATGSRREIAPDWDRSADSLMLSGDGRSLYTTADDLGQHPLFQVDIATGQVRKLVDMDGTISSATTAGPMLAFTRNSLASHDQLMVAPLSETGGFSWREEQGTGPYVAITQDLRDAVGGEVRLGDFEQFSFKGWNDEIVYGYVVKPWNYQEGRKYPVAFLIHGGPQGSFGNSWSYRWNPQTYAGQGYAVVMIDFHGSTGYGQGFTDSVSRHWGDRPLEDLQKGWAAAQQRYPFLDGGNACALGASYGGFMINWIAGNWHTPESGAWKCLVNHDGVFDTRSMGYVTDELWFTEWENDGTPYGNPQAYEKYNPVNHVAQWCVPMLVVQGEKDYRVPVDQGLSTFTALQRKGIESKLLYFPDENHWVLKPHNSILWHDTVNAWLKQHIGQ